jgi:DNA-directed RNA polymerase specialized sigma24 family protein
VVSSPATSSTLLSSWAPSPDPVASLCDRHGAALYLLALTISGDPAEAQAAVAVVLADACRPHDRPATAGPHGVRHELARRVYVQCTARGEQVGFDPAVQPLRFEHFMGWLGTLSGYQRAAIGLCVYGEHRVWQAAEVLDVSTETVHELLFWGLQDLAQWSRVPPARPAFAPLGRQSAGD